MPQSDTLPRNAHVSILGSHLLRVGWHGTSRSGPAHLLRAVLGWDKITQHVGFMFNGLRDDVRQKLWLETAFVDLLQLGFDENLCWPLVQPRAEV